MSEKPKVYFTKTITPEKILEMYKKLGIELPGNVGVKVHSGEAGNINFIKPEFFKPTVDYVKGTVIEANTSGPVKQGTRNTTEKHLKLLEQHGWTKVFDKVEILDSEGPDEELDIPNGILLKKNLIGKNTRKYDSILVLSHFKGHVMGGYGGALKQLSIGFGSASGKSLMHSGGTDPDQNTCFKHSCGVKEFKEAMADAASSIVNIYRGKMAYVNVMMNLSVDCDCVGTAKPPCMKDIGILSSLDPVAIDQACLDLVYKSDDPGKKEMIQRIEEKMGAYTIECAVKLGCGKKEYELINVD